ncbi:MAG: hypothetical protein CVU10_00005 [Bacteroidetes bacterium HGW-Bacteroidetes-5]|jgi:RNA polymerase sigma-70 factor (ECF subfamily)|nr:MAG: hypothetical protein CVU10_00005 [Bacteroidetes bacterium HGW-Bacteroidetes-5]
MFRHHIYISDKKYAFKEIFKDFYASQVLFAIKLIGSKHDSEDIVQEVFLNIWRAKPVFKNEIAFKSYIYLSTRNKCIDYLRRKRPHFENLDSAGNIEGEIESVVKEEAFRLLERAIESLPNQTREVMRCSMKGLSIQEIADELNVSVNTIKTLKSRAYKVLKESYGDTFMLLLLSFLSNS